MSAGALAITGGVLGVALAPIMVMVKYLTGWAVVPEPSWVAVVQPSLGRIMTFGSPAELWVVYGRLYTVALILMFTGWIALLFLIRKRTGRLRPWGLWILLIGMCLVIPGDAIHTARWHDNGLTMPTPGTNPVANTAYAVHMMGMNLVIAGSLMAGLSSLRRRLLAPWLAWLLLLTFPAAVLLSLTLLPTSPSGGLWLFSLTVILLGCSLASGRPPLFAGGSGPLTGAAGIQPAPASRGTDRAG